MISLRRFGHLWCLGCRGRGRGVVELREKKSAIVLLAFDASIIPNLAVFAFANEDKTVRLVVIRFTSSSAFLLSFSIPVLSNFQGPSHFSSRYNSPKLTRAVSYSRTAASEVTEGGFEIMSLNCASAFLESIFASFFASTIRAESAGAILMYLNVKWRVGGTCCL